MQMSDGVRKDLRNLQVVTLLIVTVFTGLLAVYIVLFFHHEHQESLALARREALTNFNKDLAFRSWGTMHGGVYVPETAETPPNPYLTQVPERDLVTPSGRRLTLMNPAYMMRQMARIYFEQYGIQAHLTSLELLNPGNSPDPWEKKALEAFAAGAKEVEEVSLFDGKPVFRYMQVMPVQQGCLKCHGHQGYKVGDVRGGIGVTVPLGPYLAAERESKRFMGFFHLFIWLVGMTGIGFVYARSRANIIARGRAVELLDSQKQLLETFFENAMTCNAILDREFNFIRVNSAYASADNRRVEDFPGHNHFEFFPSEARELFEQVVAEKKACTVVARPYIYPDPERGVTYWDWSLAPTLDAAGDTDKLIFILRNVTADVEAREAIRQSRDRLLAQQQILTSLIRSDIFSGADTEKTLQRLLEATASSLGVARSSIWLFTPDRNAIRCIDLFENAGNRHSFGAELPAASYPAFFGALEREELIVADDAHQHAATAGFSRNYLTPLGISAILDAPLHCSGRLEGVLCLEQVGAARAWTPEQQLFAVAMANLASSILEQAERRKLEDEKAHLQQQLLQSQKMEAIGTLTGGIAHDFNNILTAIIGFSSLLEMKMSADDPSRHTVSQILAAADRAATLTRSLLAFGRKQQIEAKVLNLNEIVVGLEKMLRRLIREDIDLTIVQAEGQLPVLADAGQIEQVLVNLVTNARDAMPDGGRIAISTAAIILDREFSNAHGYGEPGDYALLIVADNGVGMTESVRQRVFDPFFTTKEVGKGTGLGLSVCYGIVKQHNGYINCYSEPGEGTTFRIYLPLTATPLSGKTFAEEVPVSGGTETILLAEDDPTVRELTASILTEFGYTVIEAGDGAAAVARFREAGEAIDLCLFDVIMPIKKGWEALEEIRTIRPGVKALFMSGYQADFDRLRDLTQSDAGFIAKPVVPRDLLRKIREMLEG